MPENPTSTQLAAGPAVALPRRRSPLGQLLLARLREFYREPEAVFWVYGFPILMVVVLGIAFRNKPVELIPVDVVVGPDAERIVNSLSMTPSIAGDSAAVPKKLTAQTFKLEIHLADVCRQRLRTGKTDLVVVAESPESSRRSSAEPRYEYFFDPGRPESVLARSAVDDRLQRAAGRKDAAAVVDSPVDEAGGRYIDFLVPGLLGMSLMGGGMWGVGYVTVDLRIRKLLKRFLATPMKKRHFLTAIMLSRMFFMVPEVLILLVFSWLFFGVTIHGNLLVVTGVIVLGAVMFAGIGLLVASRAKTMEAVSGLMNLVMVPMWVMSGIFFSPERFPAALQPIVKALPLTPLIAVLRGVMLADMTASAVLWYVVVLSLWSVVSFILALRWFRWM
jgi:hypothetical protein